MPEPLNQKIPVQASAALAVLTTPDGRAPDPHSVRDTADARHRVVALLSEDAMTIHVTREVLATALDGDCG